MDWSTILQGAAGALEGGLEGYSWGKQYEQRGREIDQKGEIARLNAEIKQMLGTMNETGRNTRAADANANRRDIASMQQETAANAESGRNARFESGITARGLWQTMQDNTRRRGQDLTSDAATMRDGTTRRGQDLGHSDAVMRDGTARRGQDLSFDAAEMRDETTQRGQMLDAAGAVMRDGTTRRGQDLRPRSATGLPPVGEELAPGAATPAVAPDRAAQAAQLRAAIDAVNNARTPAAKAAAVEKLRALRAQVK